VVLGKKHASRRRFIWISSVFRKVQGRRYAACDVRTIGLNCVDERHPGNHRGVAKRLEVSEAVVCCPLQLNNDEARLFVHREEIDAAVAFVPT
jgi:hypothetical protein